MPPALGGSTHQRKKTLQERKDFHTATGVSFATLTLVRDSPVAARTSARLSCRSGMLTRSTLRAVVPPFGSAAKAQGSAGNLSSDLNHAEGTRPQPACPQQRRSGPVANSRNSLSCSSRLLTNTGMAKVDAAIADALPLQSLGSRTPLSDDLTREL